MEIYFWVVAIVVLAAIEMVTVQLVTIWFAAGALAAFIAAEFGTPIEVQLILFLIVSSVCLLLLRPVANRWLGKGKIKTNAGSLIGETAIVTRDILCEGGLGKAMIRGQEWSAAAADPSQLLKEGDRVRVLEIRGVKLIVEKLPERKPQEEA